MATIPGDCGCDGAGCDVCEQPHPAPESKKLMALRARLVKAKAARERADRSACSATARLSEAEEREAGIQAQINSEIDS